MFARSRKHARREIRLRQKQVLLRTEEEEAELVFRGCPHFVLPADGYVKADRETCEILRA